MKHLYDITKTIEENIAGGPFWEGEIPPPPYVEPQYTLFGRNIISPLGVAACPLTVNSKFINLLSKLGYGFFTYKSVRTVEWKGNAFPHWKYVDAKEDWTVDSLTREVKARFEPFGNNKPTMVNSFGVQSPVPEVWIADVNKTRELLPDNQLLMLSLMFTAVEGRSFIEDAALIAEYGNKTKSDAFEINLAHPNTKGSLIYEDIELSTEVCRAVREKLGNRPLVAKIGYYKDPSLLKQFMQQTKGIVDGISSTNTYSMKVVGENGEEAFSGRPTAGVSGAAVKKLSQEQAKRIVECKKELGLGNYTVIGIGGVIEPKDVDDYLALGVDVVQSAVGVWENPYLGIEYLKGISSL